jgi:hypothetical protein
MFMHNGFSTVLKMPTETTGSERSVDPASSKEMLDANKAQSEKTFDEDGEGGSTFYTRNPNKTELANYRTEISEIREKIKKQKGKKKKAIKFFVIGAVCSVMLGIGLLMPYGPENLTALQSLQGGIGGASGLQTAQLAFGFSAAGFAIPIAMTVISLMVALFSNSKINKLEKEVQLIKELSSGVSSQDQNIKRDKVVQIQTALTAVKARSDGLQGKPIRGRNGVTHN